MSDDVDVTFGMGDAARIDRSVMYTERVVIGGPTQTRRYRPPVDSAGTCTTVRFRIAAPIAGTMSAICFIHAVDAGFTLADVPGKANLEFSGNPFPGTPNIIVCDPMCTFFNEPQAGLTNRLGWAKYMQPLIANTCQTNAAYLVPQWEVFALNCVLNPQC